MSLEVFYIADENPNHRVGGGGCLCSPTGPCGDGPYAIFNGGDMESIVSPFAVLCASCARAAHHKLRRKRKSATAEAR